MDLLIYTAAALWLCSCGHRPKIHKELHQSLGGDLLVDELPSTRQSLSKNFEAGSRAVSHFAEKRQGVIISGPLVSGVGWSGWRVIRGLVVAPAQFQFDQPALWTREGLTWRDSTSGSQVSTSSFCPASNPAGGKLPHDDSHPLDSLGLPT